MNDLMQAERAVLDGAASLPEYICAASESAVGAFAALETEYWKSVRDAHKNGKKLVAYSGPVPNELLFAADCVPVNLDMLPAVIATGKTLTAELLRDVETHVSQNLCGCNKLILGALRHGSIEIDALVRAPISCQSVSSALNLLQGELTVPVYTFHTPTKRSERNIEYMVNEVRELADFLGELTGAKPQLETLRRLMNSNNRAKLLLDDCAKLRAGEPCPMSSHMTELGRLYAALGATGALETPLEAEIEYCRCRAEKGDSPCKNGEKHRAYVLQSPLWCLGELTRWLEEKYDIVTVCDGLGYEYGGLYESAESMEECFAELSKSLFTTPALHGGAQNGMSVLERAVITVDRYKPDVLFFLGDRWCRQSWGLSKMLSDTLQERCGRAPFFTDVDGIDPAYKDLDQIKAQLSEYIEAVVLGK